MASNVWRISIPSSALGWDVSDGKILRRNIYRYYTPYTVFNYRFYVLSKEELIYILIDN